MDDANLQFDSLKGGRQTIPSAINLSDFLKHRMEEIVSLTETIKESPYRGQTFQRLPKHMRRRQMSHYIRRLPRRLQRPYLLSLKDGLPEPSKRPSRKFRRRPSNLLLEYNRRQRERVWLETHIWHAKRFHMINKWGYRLPEKPTNKSFRACYRAISEHCLVTDISYYNCIELEAPQSTLLEGLKQCTSSECGLTFGALTYLKGTKEGSVTMFHPNSYPEGVIGNVRFMWKPTDSNESVRKIWIWVHPLIHDECVDSFKNLFHLKLANETMETLETMETSAIDDNCDAETEVKTESKKSKKKNRNKKIKNKKRKIEQIKLLPKKVPFSRTPKYINEDEKVTMILLKDTLNRFQLTGPLSQAIISQAFRVKQVEEAQKSSNVTSKINYMDFKGKKRKLEEEEEVEIVQEVKKMKTTLEGDTSGENHHLNQENIWWKNYFKIETNLKNWNLQKVFYEKLQNCSIPTDVPQGTILSLVIGDPRLTIPKKREKTVSQNKGPCQILENSIDPCLSVGPIWNSDIRDQVSLTKLTTHEINEARNKKIVPGFDAEDVIPDNKQSRIPILLVQRPGVDSCQGSKLGFGSGWDVICPAGFGMPIWLSLIFRGARSGGLRETELLQLECNNLKEYLQPDGESGKSESNFKCEELKCTYFKLPPGKRPNYIKLGIPSPFYCPWKLLVNEWIRESESLNVENQSFRVLRSQKLLSELQSIVKKFDKQQNALNFDRFVKSSGSTCLVPISIECADKGRPKDLALICLPREEDLKNSSCPTELPHSDENESLRKILKSEHSKMLKSLRRRRRKDRSKLKEEFANSLPGKLKWKDILKSNSAPSDKISEEYKAKMESLWIPQTEKLSTIINCSSRKILGYVVKGDFCFSKSFAVALGYVTILGLAELFTVCKNTKSKLQVLIRNNNEVQYRFGRLKILI